MAVGFQGLGAGLVVCVDEKGGRSAEVVGDEGGWGVGEVEGEADFDGSRAAGELPDFKSKFRRQAGKELEVV